MSKSTVMFSHKNAKFLWSIRSDQQGVMLDRSLKVLLCTLFQLQFLLQAVQQAKAHTMSCSGFG